MSHPERALEFGTEAHYRDAAYYDQAYRRRRADVRFYAAIAQAYGGPVLELGVGTGRIAIETARGGVPVVGVDRIPEMLERARARLRGETREVRGRVELLQRDVLRLRLGRRFPVVTAPFNVFMHLYRREDWERALAVVKAHLAPRGRLVFDILMPQHASLARDPLRTYRGRQVRLPPDGRAYRYGEAFDYDPVSQVQLVTMSFDDAVPGGDFFITPLAHRYVFPAELEALLHYNGFELVDRWGDFARGPLESGSESQVVVAKRRGRS